MRALLLVLDSVGCGFAPDASLYGDPGANTLGHILAANPGLELSALYSFGLWKILTGDVFDARSQHTVASYGRMQPRSAGKDSVTGHWELTGVILKQGFATFDSIPWPLVEALTKETGMEFLGNTRQSGTAILEQLGAEHLRTGRPILYTSADSVLQIAAHENVLPQEALYDLCRTARRHSDAWAIGRVIARPFTGAPGGFARTAGRQDYAIIPPRTVLNAIADEGFPVEAVGKVTDLFGGSGITAGFSTSSNAEGMARIEQRWQALESGLLFANLVDFDTLYGHRRDLEGYTRALVEFDRWLSGFLPQIETDDLLIITADHGNDPTFPGTDHTREEVPLMVLHEGPALPLGTRKTFADVAASLSHFFGLKEKTPAGVSFLRKTA